MVAFFAIFSEFGISTYQTRQVAIIRRSGNVSGLLADALFARALLVVVSLAILLPLSIAIDKPPDVRKLIWLLAGAMTFTTLAGAFTSTISGFERFRLYSLLSLITQSVNTLSGLAVLAAGLGIVGIGGAQLGSALICSAGIALVVHFRIAPIAFAWSLERAKTVIRAAAPLGVTALLTMLYYRASFIFLSHFRGDLEVGYYNSAYSIINSLLLLPATFSMTVLPRMSEYTEKEPERLDVLYHRAYMYMFYFGFSAAAGVTLLAGPIFDLLYPDSYLPAVPVLQILIWALALMFMTSLQGTHLVARNMKKKLLIVVAAATAVNFILNALLVPSFGRYGAAVTAVVSESVSWIGGFLFLRRHLPVRVLFVWILPLAPALAAMAVFLVRTDAWPLIVRIAIGAIIVIVLLTLFGGLRRDDFRMASRLWKKNTIEG